MKQKTFDLTEPQLDRLAMEALRSGQGQAEIVRAALEMLFASRSTPYPTSRATSQAVAREEQDGRQPEHQQGHQPTGAGGGGKGVGVLGRGVSSGTTQEQKDRKTPRSSRVSSPPPETPPDLIEPLGLWLGYKAERREGYTPSGAMQLLRKLLALGTARARAAIEHSMAQNYAGVYEPNNGRPARASPHRALGATNEHMAAISAIGSEEWIAPDYFAKEGA